ncbi:MAG: transcriptional regulator, LuxR family [Proteobacteria bacterium]|nr:transcriptional regulator, LuxR family [Pseudomonadota bacterium]
MHNSLSIQSHFQLLLWLQGDFQEAIQHDVLICFSGTNGGDAYHYDIISAIPGIRNAKALREAVHELRKGIHQRWVTGSRHVTSASLSSKKNGNFDESILETELHEMKHILFHAIPDTRFKSDHLYILLRRDDSFTEHERKLFELLLPHVDAAVRKTEGLPIQEPEQVAAPNLINSLIKSGLSTREIEILEWVRSGKTNIEIGMILEISAFTVKNHLQRIFRKINVSNRAQAVGKLEELANNGNHEPSYKFG